MKKIIPAFCLSLTFGLCPLASSIASAADSPFSLKLGGYLNAWVGYNDGSKEKLLAPVNKVAVGTEGKIFFTADSALKNGLKVGAVAMLNISRLNQNGWLDHVYIHTEGRFGKVLLGATDNVAVWLHHKVTDAGVFDVDDTRLAAWLGLRVRTKLYSTGMNFDGNSQKVSYFSPKIAGFQAAASYIPGARYATEFNQGDGAYNSTVQRPAGGINKFSSAYVISAAYDGKFGDFALGADTSFIDINNVSISATTQYNLGLKLEYKGLRLGAGGAFADNSSTKGLGNNYAYDFGVGYENDAYFVTASYYYAKNGKDESGKNWQVSKASFEMYQLSGRYKLGAGLDAFASLGYVKVDDKSSITSASNTDVWSVVTGLAMRF